MNRTERVVARCKTAALLCLLALTTCSVQTYAAPVARDFAKNASTPGVGTVLMFVSYNDVWWAEYKVMYEALLALGYAVDVRSSEPGAASSYQSGGENTIQTSAAAGPGGYSAFTDTFAAQFAVPWNPGWNAPDTIPVQGRIQDVASMDPYVAFVVPGGIGAADYAYDGGYVLQGPPGHQSAATNVQAAAERVAALIVEALQSGKPVLTQCHGAKLTAFARAPGTAGQGLGGLGLSILEGRSATGFHLDNSTAIDYAALGVQYLGSRNVVVDGPSPARLGGSDAGASRVITTRDWYPQTVAHAASTLHNMLTSYPKPAELSLVRKALIIHGGAVIEDVLQCAPSNQTTNDVPCNWGTNWPADYSHVSALLSANSANDPYRFVVSDVNLMGPAGALPFAPGDTHSVLTYLRGFDVVIYFKHWSTGVTPQFVNAMLQYADEGAGLVALHHGLFNQGAINSLTSAFGAESNLASWAGSTNPAAVPSSVFMNTNYGEFVTSYATAFDAALTQPAIGFPASPLPPNRNDLGYPAYSLADELYLNMQFLGAPAFGSGVGEVNLLLANNHVAAPNQTITAGFSKRYNPSADATIGRLAYLQPGENRANYLPTSRHGQMVRNAALWASLARPACSLDIDVDGQINAATDGVLVIRHLLGLSSTSNVAGSVNPAGLRTGGTEVANFIQRMIDSRALDLDGDDSVNAATDGVMLLRAMLGLRDEAVTDGALGNPASTTRATWSSIRGFLNQACNTSW
jgi:putative intracellular protease/amidase